MVTANFKRGFMDKVAAITLDIEKGDTLLGGRFKNMKTIVEDIGTDELGQPTINGKKLLSFRILKNMPKTTEKSAHMMTNFERGFRAKLAEAAASPNGTGKPVGWAARSNFSGGGANAKSQFNNLSRNAALCSASHNVSNGNAKNVRTPKPAAAVEVQEQDNGGKQ